MYIHNKRRKQRRGWSCHSHVYWQHGCAALVMCTLAAMLRLIINEDKKLNISRMNITGFNKKTSIYEVQKDRNRNQIQKFTYRW